MPLDVIPTTTSPAAWGDGTADRPHEIILSRDGMKGDRCGYTVHFRGEPLGRWTDPEFSACRALLAAGYTGRLETRWKGEKFAAMRMDIEKASKLCTRETPTDGPRIVKYVPFKDKDIPKKPRGPKKAAKG
jgi:hypothetical protein